MVRWLPICCLLFAVSLAGATKAADPPIPAVEGCLGQDIRVCERSFARVLREGNGVDDLEEQLKKGGGVRLSGHAPNIPGSFVLNAELAKTNHVTAASIILPYIPSTVPTTESGYTKSGLYEGVVILLGSSCAPSRAALYQLFEEKIKPTLKDRPNGAENSEAYLEKAESIHLCKHTLTYSTLFGTDAYHLTLKNPPGSFVFPVLTVQ